MKYSLNEILDQIRPNRSSLYTFFAMMPKGGDLHHHYSGSIYSETYIDYVITNNYYINLETLDVIEKPDPKWPDEIKFKWVPLPGVPNLDVIKLKLLRRWSDKDFVRGEQSPDEHFFSTFPAFSPVSSKDYIKGLQQLKVRALSQKLNYIETIFASVPPKGFIVANSETTDKQMWAFQEAKDQNGLYAVLDSVFAQEFTALTAIADKHTTALSSYHKDSKVEDAQFTLRFQNYAARFKKPTDMFADLMACFISSNSSPLIVGVNIVAAENGAVAMRDYWLHMQFFGYLENKFPDVSYSIHAGELVSGMVAPEYLGTHIRETLYLKNLKRIGHAVDIIYDNDFINTITSLKTKGTAIEINLSSNEFILGVSEDVHPIELYYRNGIPIVICTDDEGVLRTSISEQYVLAAHRYKLSYNEIKEIVKNSIRYSLLEDQGIKEQLLTQLGQQFEVFEKAVQEYYLPLVTTQEVGEIPQLKMMNLSLR